MCPSSLGYTGQSGTLGPGGAGVLALAVEGQQPRRKGRQHQPHTTAVALGWKQGRRAGASMRVCSSALTQGERVRESSM